MLIPKVVIPLNPDGSRMTTAQRNAVRRAADSERQRVEREQKAQAAMEALLAPPPPKPPSYDQRQAARAKQDEGRKLAEARQAELAALNEGPKNPYRGRADEIESQLGYRRHLRARFEAVNKMADDWDKQQVAEKAAAERQAAIDNDPAVKLAREAAGFLVKAAGDEFANEANECAGIAAAGDSQLYWQRARQLEQKVWAAEDKRRAELAATRAASDAAFAEQVTKADAAKERLDFAAKQIQATLGTEQAAPDLVNAGV